MGKMKNTGRAVAVAHKTLAGVGKAAVAGATGAAVAVGNFTNYLKEKAAGAKNTAGKNKKSGEGIVMKKSTFAAILVALAAVAGVLAALYFYVLRREKELDEYEQLLFSEDFNDDLPEDDEDYNFDEEEPADKK